MGTKLKIAADLTLIPPLHLWLVFENILQKGDFFLLKLEVDSENLESSLLEEPL